ncbi:SDR family NAD(P)-dependent oxidoreductase [Rhodococcus artemisiae]|uniref:Glucose 1-dehydrogenase n=1 Tax=Rhodococcus artemisiae TaxID=714159 RepID=A0ABU7L8C4_9NOCA|nr:glucose 1-dehydrogenase [Rhodococcus artemisiae]MEE2057784.1 glucose 1-dehydrogenase [Rhodococcus artemisiae]
MSDRLEGKIAVVTGGASGIGEASVRRFVDEGARVVIADVDDQSGKSVADELGSAALFVHADVTDQDDWDHLLAKTSEHFAPLDVLVNNAGGGRGVGKIVDEVYEGHRAILDLNLSSVWMGTRAALPVMGAHGGGSIVNISSIDGLVGVDGMTSYAASKFAVTGLTRTVAFEGGPHNVRINSVHPGFIRTPMTAKHTGAVKARLESAIRKQPLTRFGTPEDIAHAVLFFASDESSYCTGTSLVVDGGQLAGPHRDPM